MNISSEVVLPELVPGLFAGNCDLKIEFGSIPESVPSSFSFHKAGVAFNDREYLIRVGGVATYYAAGGNLIIIDPFPGADDKSIRFFLLTTVITAILNQRGAIVLRAAGFLHQDEVVLLCGIPGAGKSSVAFAIKNESGYTMFTDDLCVFNPSAATKSSATALPSYPVIKLWRDTFVKSGLEVPPEENSLRQQLPRYNVPCFDDFSTAPRLVKKVFILEQGGLCKQPGIVKLPVWDAFQILRECVYAAGSVFSKVRQKHEMDVISALLRCGDVYQINRPEKKDSLKQVLAIIKDSLDG